MHGLVNRSIQRFLRDTYGEQAWAEIALSAKLGFSNFEVLMPYDDILTLRVIDAATEKLSKPVPKYWKIWGHIWRHTRI